VREDSCREMYGTDLDCLDSTDVIANDGSDDALAQALFEGEDWEFTSKVFTVGELTEDE